MKRTAFLFGVSALILSCNQPSQQQESTIDSTTITSESHETNIQDTKTDFKIEDIAISNVDIGNFPFINLPKGLQETNKPLIREFDVCFFPIHGIMTPFEGKLYKTFVSPVRGEDFSQHFFENSIAEYLQSIGAVKIFDGEISKEEYERYNKQDPNKGGEGDIGYAGQNIKFWVLRTKDKGNVYVQYLANNAGASLNILQEAAFKQTITKVTADEIVSDLTQKGKSILYINFDVDKSNITGEGMEIVNQIAAALQKDKKLKISIEGHTDNSGDATHNKKLSDDRAHAVLNSLAAQKIDNSRLSAKGLGAEKPLANNDTEEKKAKNRRVELVKVN